MTERDLGVGGTTLFPGPFPGDKVGKDVARSKYGICYGVLVSFIASRLALGTFLLHANYWIIEATSTSLVIFIFFFLP